jgi:2,5-diketo-D-gluconate reductase B
MPVLADFSDWLDTYIEGKNCVDITQWIDYVIWLNCRVVDCRSVACSSDHHYRASREHKLLDIEDCSDMSDIELPAIGLGTSGITDPDILASGLEMGYEYLDTAQFYGNEDVVGKAISQADISRDDFVLATKIWYDQLGYDEVFNAVEESLDRLGVETIDLLYVHWPLGHYAPEETIKAYNELVEQGTISHIGVSNFSPDLTNKALEYAEPTIAVNQVELHPLLQQDTSRQHAREHNIHIAAYGPLLKGYVSMIPELQSIAEKHNVSETSVALAWSRQLDTVMPVAGAETEDHLRENLDSLDFDLDSDDMGQIENIGREIKAYGFTGTSIDTDMDRL